MEHGNYANLAEIMIKIIDFSKKSGLFHDTITLMNINRKITGLNEHILNLK